MLNNESDLVKVNVRLKKSDLEFITEVYNPDGKGVGYNEIIRNIVHAHVKATRERISDKQGAHPNEPAS